ncbi:MAG: hypothetical protein AAGC55_03200 [Myxococcota bacterium]
MDTATTRPRFRTDLVAQPIDESGQRFVDVTDPESGTTFRFYEVEYSIACAMDGQRDLPGLAQWAVDELGIAPKPTPTELQRVISTLSDLGYLSDGSARTTDFGLGHAGVAEAPPDPNLPTGVDVELGLAGVDPSSESIPIPKAPDIGLGNAGGQGSPGAEVVSLLDDVEDLEPTTIKKREDEETSAVDLPPPPVPGDQVEPVASLTLSGRPNSDDDGPTNLPRASTSEFTDEEVSVDLTDHLKLGPDAVKEAVRQSKLIQAAEADEIRQRASTPPPTPAATPPTPAQPTPTELPDKPAAVAKPVEPPEQELVIDRKPVKEQSSSVGLLLVLLVVILLGVAAAEYFLNIIGLREMLGLDEQSEVQPPPAKPPKPAKKPEPKPPTAQLAAVAIPAQEVTAAVKGSVDSILAAGTEVQADDIVVKLRGYERIEKKMKSTDARRVFYEERLKKAQASNNASEIAKAEAKVEEKQESYDSLAEELEALLIKAPTAGVIKTELADRASVESGQVLFSVELPDKLGATFTMPEGKSYKADDEVKLAATSDNGKQLSCKVTASEGQSVTVECPPDSDFATDTEVVLPLP